VRSIFVAVTLKNTLMTESAPGTTKSTANEAMSTYRVRHLETMEEMLSHHALLQSFYPNMQPADYAEKLAAMLPNGYKQIGVFLGEKCVGIAGYWIMTRLYCGKYIDIDNVVVHPEFRSAGVGKVIMRWLEEFGKMANCRHAILDAYVENQKAHRFYFREGYFIRGYHFMKPL
jgi:GNAT superfamily N-acetyltransferase